MMIIYIDIILLTILLFLILFTCGYCGYRVYRMQQNGQVALLLRPTKVLFSHKKDADSEAQLRTVVAYQNPFTGDYCVHKNREPTGYMNSLHSQESTDSGLSDEYEPLNLVPLPKEVHMSPSDPGPVTNVPEPVKVPTAPVCDNSVNKTWKWNYTEYQI